MINKIIMSVIFIFFVSSCDKKEKERKCVQVVNEFNLSMKNVKVIFHARRERNLEEWGGLVTTLGSFHRGKNLGTTDIDGKICIEEHADSDKNYIYIRKSWYFETKTHREVYFSFDEIPKKVILKNEKDNCPVQPYGSDVEKPLKLRYILKKGIIHAKKTKNRFSRVSIC